MSLSRSLTGARLWPGWCRRGLGANAGAVWAKLDELAREIGATWLKDIPAGEAVSEQRRAALVYVVDASVWASRLVVGDAHHGPSRRWLGQLLDRGVAVVAPAILPAEMAGAIVRRTGRSDLALRLA